MERAEFERSAAEGFERLPEWVRQKIKNVALLIEDEPPVEIRKREKIGRNETLLGYYQGIPLSLRGEHYGVGPTMPDTITLYQIPIEQAAAADQRDVRDVVAETIWHEFAHHFGMNEQEVSSRERKHS